MARVDKVVLFICIYIDLITNVLTLSDQKRLTKHLLKNYEDVGIYGRPIWTPNHTLPVKVGMALLDIDVDEAREELSVNVWFRLNWIDILLRWNPEDFGGIYDVRVPVDKIWVPDILLYNAATPDKGIKLDGQYMGVVDHTGSVLLIQHMHLTVQCSLDTTYFPFDQQLCRFKFGSWTFNGEQVKLEFFGGTNNIDLNDYTMNNEWNIIDTMGVKNTLYYPCCKEPYENIIFGLNIRRMPGMTYYAIVLPAILLSVLTTFIFFFPANSEFRKLYGLLVFLSSFILLLNVKSVLPPGAVSIPHLVIYMMLLLILNALAILLSFTIGYIQTLGKTKLTVPQCLKQMIVDPIVRNVYGTKGGCDYNGAMYKGPRGSAGEGDDVNLLTRQDSENTKGETVTTVAEIGNLFRSLVHNFDESQERSDVIRQWNILASILDLLFFCVYLVVICVMGGALLTSPFS